MVINLHVILPILHKACIEKTTREDFCEFTHISHFSFEDLNLDYAVQSNVQLYKR
jgi:hypothetical protein